MVLPVEGGSVALGSGGSNQAVGVREEFACGGGRRNRGGIEAEPAEDRVCSGAAISGVDEVESVLRRIMGF